LKHMTHRSVFLGGIYASPVPYLLPKGGRIFHAPCPELVESGKLKLVLLAHVALKCIDLCRLWLRVSPELYGLFRSVVLRHLVTQFMMKTK